MTKDRDFKRMIRARAAQSGRSYQAELNAFRAQKVAVEVRCIGCKSTREIKAGEIAPGDHPMCTKCGMPMVAVEAKGGA